MDQISETGLWILWSIIALPGALLAKLLYDDVKARIPKLAKRTIDYSISIVPQSQQGNLSTTWNARLSATSGGELSKLLISIRCLISARTIARRVAPNSNRRFAMYIALAVALVGIVAVCVPGLPAPELFTVARRYWSWMLSSISERHQPTSNSVWLQFQTPFLAMAIINIVLGLLPMRSRQIIESESMKLESFRRYVKENPTLHIEASRLLLEVQMITKKWEQQNQAVRSFSVCVAALSLCLLFWSTYAANDPANPIIVWGALAVSFIPAIIVAGADASFRSTLRRLSDSRQRQEKRAFDSNTSDGTQPQPEPTTSSSTGRAHNWFWWIGGLAIAVWLGIAAYGALRCGLKSMTLDPTSGPTLIFGSCPAPQKSPQMVKDYWK